MPAKGLSSGSNYYHIYNSGVEKRLIFTDAQDYEVFQGYLNDYLSAPASPESTKKVFTVHGKTFKGTPHQPKNYLGQIELMAYSLMPNHFHLILHQKASHSISGFIRSLCTRYSMYFNKKYQRSGSLFAGPYKSAHIKDASQLLPLTNFIHHGKNHNSSYPEYSGKRETSWLNTRLVQKAAKDGSVQKEKELSKDITLENEDQLLERRDLSKNTSHSPNIDRRHKKFSRIPEVSALTAVFFVLLGLGLRNINISQAKSTVVYPTPTPDVLSESTQSTDSNELKQIIDSVVSKHATDSAGLKQSTDSADLKEQPSQNSSKTLVVIEIPKTESFINIREGPSVNSAKIGEAVNGDIFELVDVNSGWYKVSLPNNLTGYISAKGAYLQPTINQ